MKRWVIAKTEEGKTYAFDLAFLEHIEQKGAEGMTLFFSDHSWKDVMGNVEEFVKTFLS